MIIILISHLALSNQVQASSPYVVYNKEVEKTACHRYWNYDPRRRDIQA